MIRIQFAENLKQFMKDEKITQSALSKKLNISQSSISDWLSKKKEPSLTSLWLVADYFNCTVDELLGRGE